MPTPLSPRQEIWRGLLFGQRSMLLELATELKRDFGLSVPAYEALHSLTEAPEHTLTASQLASLLLYSSGSASNLIKRLEGEGYVARVTDSHDARVVRVILTPTGFDLVTRATAAHVQSIARSFEPLIEEQEVDLLLTFARRLAEHEGVRSAPPVA